MMYAKDIWPEAAGEAVATAWYVLEAAGYSDPGRALIDLAEFVGEGLAAE